MTGAAWLQQGVGVQRGKDARWNQHSTIVLSARCAQTTSGVRPPSIDSTAPLT